MLSKRVIASFFSLAILFALIMSACGGSSDTSKSSGPSNQPETITIWHDWQGDYLNAKKAIFDAYHKQHPNITIKLVQQDQLVDKSITALKGGKGPDIIAWTDDSLGQLAASRMVVPMDQYLSSDYINSTFTPAAAKAVNYNGKIYGVPETTEAITIMYNKDLVKESDMPKTTDDMLNFAKTYQQKNPGKYGIVWNTEDAYFNAPWFYGFGGNYVTEDGTVGVNSAKSLAAAQFISSFRPYMPKQISYDIASSLFTEGKAAAIINGPWSYSDYATKAKMNLGFAQLPIVTANNSPATPFVGVKSLWMTKIAKDPATVADIMKFYTSKDNQLSMIKATGEIPANAAAAADPTVTGNVAIAAYSSQAKVGVPLPNTPYMSALWKPVQDALTAVWSGSQSVDAAFGAAQKAAEAGVKGINS
ncbi:sugar ABC transporter substrate-binding protein [Dictyobacter kobayashii]|uniref:ABC transporter substrate-binding protein n=1 Tax=Dictyobacter kobayashii TaxID=2014872 RepID=A0A402AJE1_9CHLR|nr:extracellular solute-binding protein [Dictyobacter kobayashii]GCE19165.1 ABC transporter substrate-binding protein [Dictyobacter kobayashii]